MFTSSPLTALSAVLIFAAAVRGDAACDLTTVYPGASQFLTSLSVHASSLFDGKESLAGMTVFVPTDKFLDDSGITMFSLGAFQGENALPVMRRHVFAVDPFGNAAASDGAALRNYDGALYVTQTRTYASPTNLRIGAAGQPAEEGALVRRAALRGCGDVTVHIIDRLLPEPSAEFNGVLYTNMERLLPVEPPQCTPLLAALRTIKGASTFLASDRIHDFERMAQPDPGEKAMLTVLVPNNAAFKAYETFDPPAYSQMMSDPSTWRKVASLHIVKTHWAQADGPDSLQLKTLAWCDSGPCMLSATVDDAGQAFVRPLRGEGPEARASTHGVAFCHGIIYPIDDVLRIDDATEVIAAAEEEDGGSAIGEAVEDDYGVYQDEGEADAAPGVGSPGADYADAGDSVGLAPRAVLAGDQAEAVDGVEERGSNADSPAGAREDREPSDDPYIDAGSVIPDKEEWEQERTREGVPDAAGDDAADYTEDEGAGEVADAPDDREPSDDPFIDAGSVIPDKEEWEQERAREQA